MDYINMQVRRWHARRPVVPTTHADNTPIGTLSALRLHRSWLMVPGAALAGPAGCPVMLVAALLLGDMGVGSVHRLDVFAEGAGVCVTLCAAWNLAHIRFLKTKYLNARSALHGLIQPHPQQSCGLILLMRYYP